LAITLLPPEPEKQASKATIISFELRLLSSS